MENQNVDNVVNMNGDNAGAQDTSNIVGTDYVEPQGKVRKVLKYVLGGVATVAVFVAGLLTGKAMDKNDDKDEDQTESNGEDSKD